MQVPRFSIIVPTHNRAHLLPRALESVRQQDFEDWELIVINDGSTDATLKVLKEYQADERIRIITQENRQLNGARNRGVQEMRGLYGCFLDDDDEFLPGHLATLWQAIRVDERRHDLYRSGEILQRGARKVYGHNYRNNQDILPQYWRQSTGMFGVAISRSILRSHPFNEAHLLLDDFVWLSAILSQYSLFQLPGYGVLVHLHPNRRSNTYLDESLLISNLQQLDLAYKLPGVAERVPETYFRSQVVHQYMHFSRKLQREKEFSRALRAWWQGAKKAGSADLSDVMKTILRFFIR